MELVELALVAGLLAAIGYVLYQRGYINNLGISDSITQFDIHSLKSQIVLVGSVIVILYVLDRYYKYSIGINLNNVYVKYIVLVILLIVVAVQLGVIRIEKDEDVKNFIQQNYGSIMDRFYALSGIEKMAVLTLSGIIIYLIYHLVFSNNLPKSLSYTADSIVNSLTETPKTDVNLVLSESEKNEKLLGGDPDMDYDDELEMLDNIESDVDSD